MGMSASQARLLSLQARQSNLEYQGQQINQERTILSQQATALYNSLLSMTVPTPPSTTDFQMIKYTGELGATQYSFDANSIKPNGNDTYTIIMQETKHGDSLQKNAQIALVDTSAAGSFRGVEYNTSVSTITPGSTVPTGTYKKDTQGNKYMEPVELKPDTEGNYNLEGTYYIQEGDRFVEFNGTPTADTKLFSVKDTSTKQGAVQVSAETTTLPDTTTEGQAYLTRNDVSRFHIFENGTVRPAILADFAQDPSQPNLLKFKAGVKYIEASEDGQAYQVKGDVAGVTVGGKGVHRLNEEEKTQYGDAIANCGLKDAQGNPYGVEDFYMYYNDNGGAVFVLISDVEDGNNNAVTYSYAANGEFTKNQEYKDAKLTFDPTNGRITEIAIPNYDDNGEIASWTSISVKAETVTDEAAYNDAYAQYEYDTYLYDKKNKEINAKTEVIQQEDKNLELKLQRLDNERTQITTEIEAVEKVINDNIEASYKTFSG